MMKTIYLSFFILSLISCSGRQSNENKTQEPVSNEIIEQYDSISDEMESVKTNIQSASDSLEDAINELNDL